MNPILSGIALLVACGNCGVGFLLIMLGSMEYGYERDRSR